MLKRSSLTAVLFAALAAALVLVPAPATAGPQPVREANYKQAFKYSRSYLRQFVHDTTVRPRWVGKTDSFWYRYRTGEGTHYWLVNPDRRAKEPLFDRVKLGAQLSELARKPMDPAALRLTRESISDDGAKFKFVVDDFQYEYDRKAEKLTKLGKAPPASRRGGRGSRFRRRRDDERRDERREDREDERDEDRREEDRRDGERRGGEGTTRQGSRRRTRDYKNFSPDRKTYLFATKHNLFLAEADKEADAVSLTTDGAEDYSFGGGADDTKARPRADWSDDSKAFYVTRSDSRGVRELFLVDSLADPRPTLRTYKYPMPGEPAIRKTELFVFHFDTKKLTRVKPKWTDESYTNIHWGKTGDELRFIRVDRLRRNLELCSIHTPTGEAKCLIPEGFENANVLYQSARYLDDSGEMIWWSERGGWGHYYLYDRDGKLKDPITSGQFRASRIVAVDEKQRLLYFEGNGREPGENVYYEHLYRVGLDGGGLTLLDPGDANHRSYLSPSRKYVVDNSSRVDAAPFSVLRDDNGYKVLDLEKADLSRLEEAGWKMPETFAVKAADGVTDLYGNLWKPFDFDPNKKYPLIAHVYPGPQQEGVTHTFTPVNSNQQLAQLGFIVIQVGHRGGAPTRSKAYASYGYFNMRDYGLADKKSAIEQLAARHPFIDIDRVGIYGHSGGGFMSAAAVLQKPYNEFFKAAVASAGNHDNNIYNSGWAERYHGLREVVVTKDDKAKAASSRNSGTSGTSGGARESEGTRQRQRNDGQDEDGEEGDEQTDDQGEGTDGKTTREKKTEEGKDSKDGKAAREKRFEIKVPTNAELAANLKGALFLVHGEVDNNVHPANTMRLADALIKANKRFDMLILPGKRHSFGDYSPYFQQRMWDFFADHLLGDRQTGADIYEKRDEHQP